MPSRRLVAALPAAALLAASLSPLHAATAADTQARAGEAAFRTLYKELVETDSSWPNGSWAAASPMP